MTKRRRARELVLRGLYAYEIHKRELDQVFDSLVNSPSLGKRQIQFAKEHIETILRNIDFLDNEIKRLAENWEIERIALIDKNILRI